MFSITNDAGRRFLVHCIRKGSRYGLNECLLHEQDDPLIEFTEATQDGEVKQSGDGQFLVRYPSYVLLRLCDDPYLWLFGVNAAWRLGAKQLRQIRDWLAAGCPD